MVPSSGILGFYPAQENDKPTGWNLSISENNLTLAIQYIICILMATLYEIIKVGNNNGHFKCLNSSIMGLEDTFRKSSGH